MFAREDGAPQLVQEVMRHSSYATTAHTYTHVMPAHSAEAALFDPPLPRLAIESEGK